MINREMERIFVKDFWRDASTRECVSEKIVNRLFQKHHNLTNMLVLYYMNPQFFSIKDDLHTKFWFETYK